MVVGIYFQSFQAWSFIFRVVKVLYKAYIKLLENFNFFLSPVFVYFLDPVVLCLNNSFSYKFAIQQCVGLIEQGLSV